MLTLSNRSISILQKVLCGLVGAIIIVTALELVFIGKNLTFSTRFTPFDSQENNLRNQSYITQAQAVIIFACILYLFLLPATTYASIKKPRQFFIPILLTKVGINGILVFLNIYFLTGGSFYRNFMTQQYHDLVNNQGLCSNNSTTLCNVGTCVRLQVFHQAKEMAIAFTVIDILMSLVFTVISILINKKHQKSEAMELIV